MWGIKKWPRKILQGSRFGAKVINATGLGTVFPPIGIAATVLGQQKPEEKEMKNFWVQIFILPNLRSLAAYLRVKDENSTGGDDEAARAIDVAVEALEKWLAGAIA